MNAKQKQEKAKIREAMKRQLAAKGIAPKQADELLEQIEDKGWAWAVEPSAESAGMLLCECRATAEVRNPERYSPNCPKCGRAWKLAEVQ